MDHLALFAPCARGLENVLAAEMRAVGASRVRALTAGVSFEGTLEIAYRACLWSRSASRVLVRIAEVPAGSPEQLYSGVTRLAWEDHLSLDTTFAVDFTASRSPITHTQYGALKVKDAIVDRFRERTGERPSVDTNAPDLRINVSARARSAVVSIDLSGDALHRRGYREPGVQVEAPLKETLAAGVLLLAGWPALARTGSPLVDPMCGSGTLVIEGAMIAGDRAPGILRSRWGFDRWPAHDAELWHSLLDEADSRAEDGLAHIPPMLGVDIDPRAVEVARGCVARAGLAGAVLIEEADSLAGLRTKHPGPGLVVFNPPYGERLGESADLAGLYRSLGSRLRESFSGWSAAAIVADEAPGFLLGIPAEHSYPVRNGRIPAHVTGGKIVPAPESSMFANRIRKNVKRLRKWIRSEGITCYRVYDADMPEYAVAVDLYEGAGPDEGVRWAYVAEYAPPKTVDEAGAQRRLAEVLTTLPEVLDVDPDRVVLKVRKRQRGSEQYERGAERSTRHVVAEGGLLFGVDFDTYLDTGLFLDHRITRAMVRDRASATRFCNLFGYTGSVTVYAAAGGAASTTTVDLSGTYLRWAEENLRRNGLSGEHHRFERADVLSWLGRQKAGSFDFIFCDPPTFSNSKRMDETFDVQRDQAALITGAVRLLAPEGELWFSTNRRGFNLDEQELSDLAVREFTEQTIPPDFARTPQVHRIWRITRAVS